jgi:hypothetical protein
MELAAVDENEMASGEDVGIDTDAVVCEGSGLEVDVVVATVVVAVVSA